MWKCISNLTVDPLTVDCWSAPPPPRSTVNSVDCRLSHCWPLTLSLLTVDPPQDQVNSVDCQSPHCWPLTLSLLTVDPFPPQDQQSAVLIVDCLTVDHWPCHCGLLPPPPQNQHRQLPFHMKEKVACWSSPSLLLISSLYNQKLNFTFSFQEFLALEICHG